MLVKGSLVTQMSGKLAGVVASHNRGGQYFRQNSTPVNTQSEYQQEVRAITSYLASYWANTLTESQRQAWNTYGLNVSWANRFGDATTLSGIAHFIRSNVPRMQAGLAVVVNAPTIYGLADLLPPTVAFDVSSGIIVTFDGTGWANVNGSALLIYASRPFSPAREFFKGPYRYAGMVEGDSGSPPTSPETITPPPFPFVADQQLGWAARLTLADGRLSGLVRGRTIAVA